MWYFYLIRLYFLDQKVYNKKNGWKNMPLFKRDIVCFFFIFFFKRDYINDEELRAHLTIQNASSSSGNFMVSSNLLSPLRSEIFEDVDSDDENDENPFIPKQQNIVAPNNRNNNNNVMYSSDGKLLSEKDMLREIDALPDGYPSFSGIFPGNKKRLQLWAIIFTTEGEIFPTKSSVKFPPPTHTHTTRFVCVGGGVNFFE